MRAGADELDFLTQLLFDIESRPIDRNWVLDIQALLEERIPTLIDDFKNLKEAHRQLRKVLANCKSCQLRMKERTSHLPISASCDNDGHD